MNIPATGPDVRVDVWTVEFDGLYAVVASQPPPGTAGGAFFRNGSVNSAWGLGSSLETVASGIVVYLLQGDVISYSGPTAFLHAVRLGLDF